MTATRARRTPAPRTGAATSRRPVLPPSPACSPPRGSSPRRAPDSRSRPRSRGATPRRGPWWLGRRRAGGSSRASGSSGRPRGCCGPPPARPPRPASARASPRHAPALSRRRSRRPRAARRRWQRRSDGSARDGVTCGAAWLSIARATTRVFHPVRRRRGHPRLRQGEGATAAAGLKLLFGPANAPLVGCMRLPGEAVPHRRRRPADGREGARDRLDPHRKFGSVLRSRSETRGTRLALGCAVIAGTARRVT